MKTTVLNDSGLYRDYKDPFKDPYLEILLKKEVRNPKPQSPSIPVSPVSNPFSLR